MKARPFRREVRRSRHVSLLLSCLLAACASSQDTGALPGDGSLQPLYTDDDRLRRPQGVEEWVFLGASVGLGYNESQAKSSGPGNLQAVHMDRASYTHFVETGEFRNQTFLALSVYEPSREDALARQGAYSGRRLALEIALKDTERFPEGWAYFDFGEGEVEAAAAFPTESCYDCHATHAAHDNVFVQFYPVLREARRRHATP